MKKKKTNNENKMLKYCYTIFLGEPLKIYQIEQNVNLNYYFLVFGGLVPWSDFPSVHWAMKKCGHLHLKTRVRSCKIVLICS